MLTNLIGGWKPYAKRQIFQISGTEEFPLWVGIYNKP